MITNTFTVMTRQHTAGAAEPLAGNLRVPGGECREEGWHVNNRGEVKVDETHYVDLKSSVITSGILTSVWLQRRSALPAHEIYANPLRRQKRRRGDAEEGDASLKVSKSRPLASSISRILPATNEGVCLTVLKKVPPSEPHWFGQEDVRS